CADEFKYDPESITRRARPASGEVARQFVCAQRRMIWVNFELLECGLQIVKQFRLASRELLGRSRELRRPNELHLPRNSRMTSAAEPRFVLPRRCSSRASEISRTIS